MILLESHNVIIQTTLNEKLIKYSSSFSFIAILLICRPSSLDVSFVDYDGVRFRMSTPERKTTLLLSMHIRCWDELVRYGALSILQREYGSLLQAQPEDDHHVSLLIDLDKVPTGPGESLCAV